MHRSDASAERPRVDRMVLPGGGGVVADCRDFVRHCLTVRGWLDDPGDEQQAVVEDVLLMTSELVTNACLHAGGPRELIVSGADRRLRVLVVDASQEQPALRPPAVRALPGGLGLRVLQWLARSWGTEPRREGKAVWFEIDRAC